MTQVNLMIQSTWASGKKHQPSYCHIYHYLVIEGSNQLHSRWIPAAQIKYNREQAVIKASKIIRKRYCQCKSILKNKEITKHRTSMLVVYCDTQECHEFLCHWKVQPRNRVSHTSLISIWQEWTRTTSFM